MKKNMTLCVSAVFAFSKFASADDMCSTSGLFAKCKTVQDAVYKCFQTNHKRIFDAFLKDFKDADSIEVDFDYKGFKVLSHHVVFDETGQNISFGDEYNPLIKESSKGGQCFQKLSGIGVQNVPAFGDYTRAFDEEFLNSIMMKFNPQGAAPAQPQKPELVYYNGVVAEPIKNERRIKLIEKIFVQGRPLKVMGKQYLPVYMSCLSNFLKANPFKFPPQVVESLRSNLQVIAQHNGINVVF